MLPSYNVYRILFTFYFETFIKKIYNFVWCINNDGTTIGLWPVEHASHARDLAGFESRVKRASQFKKSQTAVSITERHFTLSVVCLIVECTWRQRKGN